MEICAPERQPLTLPGAAALTDADIVARVRAGETALFEILMRRHNQRVYRIVRSVLKDEGEAEDAMQQAYISAFTHLKQFEDRAQFSTWLIRIALHEAMARRKKARGPELSSTLGVDAEQSGEPMHMIASPQADPEQQAYAAELRRVLESAVDALPESYRAVFMLRDVEGLSTRETGEGLGLGEEAVKTRLHRARAMIRQTITAQLGTVAAGAFEFHAVRCDRVVAAVMEQIASCR